MTDLKSHWYIKTLSALVLVAVGVAQTSAPKAQSSNKSPAKPKPATVTAQTYPTQLVQQGAALFRQDCSFCHGRDATGGETGPDLTRSKLVASDVNGDKIGPVIRNGRPEKRMPPFPLSADQIASLVAFIHSQLKNA